jgi:hypothetical protein
MIFGAIDPGRIISKFYGDVLLSYISCVSQDVDGVKVARCSEYTGNVQ